MEHGDSATAPADPSRTGYTFTGWDTTFDNVTSDLTITAQYEINTYTVTFTDYDGTEFETETVEHGDSATAPADPSRTGYAFTGWDTAFDNVTSDLTVIAQYSKNRHHLTVNNGTGDGTYPVGRTVDITADQPSEGQVFDQWSGDTGALADPASAATTVTIPDRSITVTAIYTEATMFPLTVNQGIVSGHYPAGYIVAIAADEAPEGKVFDQWIGDTASVDNIYLPNTKVTMPASAIEITATYKDQYSTKYGLTVNNGSGSGEYPTGEIITLTADAAPSGQVFDKWSGDTETVANPMLAETRIIMPSAAVEITATYKDLDNINYALTVNNGSGSGEYPTGEIITLTADAAPSGQVFDQWTGDIETIANINHPETTLVMPASAARVAAVYKAQETATYTLTVIGGSGSGEYPAGETAAISANVPEGQAFVQWTGQTAWVANVSEPDTTLVMPEANVTVSAEFATNTHTLTYKVQSHGRIDGDAKQTVAHGADGAAVTAVPKTGYHFVQWSDGLAAATRTDTEVTGNMTVTAEFAVNTYTLSYRAGKNGTIDGESTQVVAHGENGTQVTAVPDAGYAFAKWSDGSTDNPRLDGVVTEDLTVTAKFVEDKTAGYSLTVTNGVGSGDYQTGRKITIAADIPPAGKIFDQWIVGDLSLASGNIAITAADILPANKKFNQGRENTEILASPYLPNTRVIMPDYSITLTPTYKTAGEQFYDLTVENGKGSGEYLPGTVVNLEADTPTEGQVFAKWINNPGFDDPAIDVIAYVDNPQLPSTLLIMPEADIKVKAAYQPAGEKTYPLSVNKGSGGGAYPAGELVDVRADDPPEGQIFDQWIGDTENMVNYNLPETSLYMPDTSTKVTATYKDQPDNTYTLTVEGGKGSGEYAPGTVVEISASAADGLFFETWTGQTGWIERPDQAKTRLVMPEGNITAMAEFTIKGDSGGDGGSGGGDDGSGDSSSDTCFINSMK